MSFQPQHYKSLTLGITIVFSIATCFDLQYPTQTYLQHAASLFVIVLLIYDIKINFLSKTAFTGIILFMLLHALGARYIYSTVPYNEWSIQLLSWDIHQAMGWERNQYDRFIHFIFGVVVFPFSYEWSRKKLKISWGAALFTGWLLIQTYGMLYEVFEWLLTILLSSEQADNYNGQQGDMWDAQKDMALALVSSSFVAIIMYIGRKKSFS